MEKFFKKGDAHFKIDKSITNNKDIDIFATEQIITNLSDKTIKQIINTANISGVKKVNLNADAHEGYGCPIGSVVATDNIIMLGPIGYDISCSMSYIQTDIPTEELVKKEVRRNFINTLCNYIPQGAGKSRSKNQINLSKKQYLDILQYGASNKSLLESLEIDLNWIENLERNHLPSNVDLLSEKSIARGKDQLGSLGSGNHFLEGQQVKIIEKNIANAWGLSENFGILTHCGSRGIGHQIATEYFEKLWKYFNDKEITLPERELVYADVESNIGKNYISSMGCAANFAIVNHLVINSAICKAINDIFPGTNSKFIYHISHNLAQQEKVNNKNYYIHRKGATRAFPKNHEALKNTKFYETGHPVIIPGSSISGSSIMVGCEGNEKNFHSTPHGSGRSMGRREANRKLSQQYVNDKMNQADVLFNKRNYPIDEFAEAYKDYDEVIKSVILAGLANEVAKLKPIFVIKGD